MTKHMVEYLHSGDFLVEISTRRLERWYGDHTAGLTLCFHEAIKHLPEDAFAFRLYTTEGDLEPRKYHGGRFYVNAKAFTVGEVETLGSKYATLLSNMKFNGWRRVLQCRTGDWQPMNDDDWVVGLGEVDDDALPPQAFTPCEGGRND